MSESTAQSTRNFRWRKLPIALKSFNSVVWDFLDRAYGGQPNAAKRLARVTGASPRTAQNWLAREHAPTGDRLADLVAEHPDLEQAVAANFSERRVLLRQRRAALMADARARQAARGP